MLLWHRGHGHFFQWLSLHVVPDSPAMKGMWCGYRSLWAEAARSSASLDMDPRDIIK